MSKEAGIFVHFVFSKNKCITYGWPLKYTCLIICYLRYISQIYISICRYRYTDIYVIYFHHVLSKGCEAHQFFFLMPRRYKYPRLQFQPSIFHFMVASYFSSISVFLIFLFICMFNFHSQIEAQGSNFYFMPICFSPPNCTQMHTNI